MATPFAPTRDELVQLWNETIKRSGVEYEEGSLPPEDPTGKEKSLQLLYPQPLVPQNIVSWMFIFSAVLIRNYDRRLEGFLREKNLL